jgi:ubiquinone/menaquinone biosynthesis C-methylase UbiE
MRAKFLALFVTLLVTAAAAQRSQSASVATERIFEAIGVGPGMTVCEMGAGDGELSIAAAKAVGPEGRIYTSELGDERIKTLRERASASGLTHITVVPGDPGKTNFPEGACDALFMRNVYHHFTDPAQINASISASLRVGGRVAVVDFTPPEKEAERPADRGKDGMHGVMPETVARELKNAGLELVATEDGNERWFMVVAAKPKS